ncbi:hypothetical protein [Pseudomethylobacillus aquaticus]
MQMNHRIHFSLALLMAFVLSAPVAMAETAVKADVKAATSSKTSAAAKAKTYTEDEFLNAFSGKSRKFITDKLGAPAKKDLAVKPANADRMVMGMGKTDDKTKRVNIEMWYYNNVVRYDAKRTYKFAELTFVNDRCMNIGFFNNN